MSSQSNASVMATVIVGIIIVAGLVGYTFYTNSSSLSSLSGQNANLKQQLSGVSQQESTLGQQVSNLNQQVSTLNQQVSVLQQKTIQVVTVSNTVEVIETTTSTTTSTVTSVTAVPESALVVVVDTYNNSTHVFTFQVQNNQNYTIYAQISATLFGGFVGGNCQSTVVGSFISQIYTFNPRTTTQTSMNLALGSYTGCANPSTNVVNSLTMSLIIPPSTSASPAYNFNVVPSYTIP